MINQYFWIDKIEGREKILMDKEKIAQYNAQAMPDRGEDAAVMLKKTWQYKEGLMQVNNKRRNVQCLYDLIDFNHVENTMARRGIVIRMTFMRNLPTFIKMRGKDSPFDVLQESALVPFETVTIHHTTGDRNWLYVQAGDVWGFVKSADIALVDDENERKLCKNRLTVLSKKIMVGGRMVPMGSRIILSSKQSIRDKYIVKLPIRGKKGELIWEYALLPKSGQMTEGLLPYTIENLVKQCFLWIGTPYEWGDGKNGIDCSSFVRYVFRSFGIDLPRNSGDIANCPSKVDVGQDDKLANVQAGDLLHMPGHIAIYLGKNGQNPHMIHASYTLGKVGISSVYDHSSDGKKYIELITGITRVAFDK